MCVLLQPALLVHLKGPGTWWLNASLQCSPDLQHAFWTAGWLVGQSITNRCTLGLPVAPLLFHLLMTPDPDWQVRVLGAPVTGTAQAEWTMAVNKGGCSAALASSNGQQCCSGV